jgi:hypothetical protein
MVLLVPPRSDGILRLRSLRANKKVFFREERCEWEHLIIRGAGWRLGFGRDRSGIAAWKPPTSGDKVNGERER